MTSFRALFLRNAAAAVVLPLAALTVFLWRDQEAAGRAALDRELRLGITAAQQLQRTASPEEFRAAVVDLDRTLDLRLTVIDAGGAVLADGEGDPARMENHLERPEVRAAIRDGSAVAERHSATLNRDMRYFAVADRSSGALRVFRAAVPLSVVRAQVRRTQLTLLVAAGAVICLALFVSTRLSRRLVQPVQALIDASSRLATGQSQVYVTPEGPAALRRLASTFNNMVDRLNSQVRSLDESQAYLEAVIRQMPEGLLVLDPRGVITRVNPAAAALLGTAQERLVGRPLLAAVLHYALDAEVRRVLSEAEAGAEPPVSTVAMLSPEKRSLRVAVGAFFLGGEERRLAGAVLIVQDQTELRRADDMRRDFVANVSHELRTPIAAIRALAETLLLRAERRPELLEDYAPRIVGECERIDRLVQDLMLLAQTESGHVSLDPEPLDSRAIAEEVVRQVEPVTTASGTRVVLHEFASEPVLADRFALTQCLRNLVDNAVRYAPEGEVRLESRVEDGQVVLTVADDGPGIPPDALGRIFERFYRVDQHRSRDHGGSGLGLSIVRHLTEAQGGRVWAESRAGYGSTFHIALPAAPQ